MKLVTCTGAFILILKIEARFASFSLEKNEDYFFSTLIAKFCYPRLCARLPPRAPRGVALEFRISDSSSIRAVVAGIWSIFYLYIPLAKEPRSTEWALALPASLALAAIGAARFCIIDCDTREFPRSPEASKVECLFCTCYGVAFVSPIDYRWRCKKKVLGPPIDGRVLDYVFATSHR